MPDEKGESARLQVELALTKAAGEVAEGRDGGLEVALMDALVDAILDGGGAAVARPYLCALFQGAVIEGLADVEQDDDTPVRRPVALVKHSRCTQQSLRRSATPR
jgi:hypothetical protein